MLSVRGLEVQIKFWRACFQIVVRLINTSNLDRVWIRKGRWVFINIGEPDTLLNLIYKL